MNPHTGWQIHATLIIFSYLALVGLLGHVGLHDGEEPLYADGDADAGYLTLLWVEHPDQLVVAAAAGHGPHLDRLPLGVLVVPQQNGLIDDTGVVVEAAREAEVEGDDVGAPEQLAVFQESLHACEALQAAFALLSEVTESELIRELHATTQLNELSDAVSRLWVQALVVHHLCAHILP